MAIKFKFMLPFYWDWKTSLQQLWFATYWQSFVVFSFLFALGNFSFVLTSSPLHLKVYLLHLPGISRSLGSRKVSSYLIGQLAVYSSPNHSYHPHPHPHHTHQWPTLLHFYCVFWWQVIPEILSTYSITNHLSYTLFRQLFLYVLPFYSSQSPPPAEWQGRELDKISLLELVKS